MFLHPPDPDLSARLAAVARRWGGDFEVVPTPDWRRCVRSFDGDVVHLTMYGRPLAALVARLRRSRRLLLAVGGAKVPPEMYRLARFNVSVGGQPHSEVAAVAVVLAQLLGLPANARRKGARLRIVPQARGKKVLEAGSAR